LFVLDQEGRIDTLINNAGAGVVRGTKAALPHMRKQRSGHVIAIASVDGLVGQPFDEIYCAAKFGIVGYTEALASYVPPNFGINV
jgi:short-subunit dehydrogenase